MATKQAADRSLPASTEEQLRKQAEAMVKKIGAPSGDKIRLLKTKKFRLPDGRETDQNLRVVVLDFVSYNAFFDQPYSEGEVIPPACFAIGAEPKVLVPSDNSPDKQSDACTGCPNNEFGSKGKGKACGNHRLLAVVEPSESPDAPMYLIQLPPTSVKHWDGYVGNVLTKFKKPIVAVSTEIWFDPESEYASPRFGNPEPNPHVGIHLARQEAALARLMTEPDVSGYTPPKKVVRAAARR